jgi:hypothetical protein
MQDHFDRTADGAEFLAVFDHYRPHIEEAARRKIRGLGQIPNTIIIDSPDI